MHYFFNISGLPATPKTAPKVTKTPSQMSRTLSSGSLLADKRKPLVPRISVSDRYAIWLHVFILNKLAFSNIIPVCSYFYVLIICPVGEIATPHNFRLQRGSNK